MLKWYGKPLLSAPTYPKQGHKQQHRKMQRNLPGKSKLQVKPSVLKKGRKIRDARIWLMAENSMDMEEESSFQSPKKENPNPNSNSGVLLIRIMSKRRTWVCLFVSVYTILLSLSWNLLKSVMSWYEIESSASSSSGWSALYISALLGVSFGVLSMVAALAVAVPATLVTWITVLVLLTFCGKPRKTLIVEGKKLTAEITGFVVKVLFKEGNIVAAVCAVVGYFALVRKHKESAGVAYFDFE